MKDYKRIMQQLTHEEQARLFDIMRKYKWILQKLENDEPITEIEQDFLDYRPYYVNDRLGIDIIEREVVFI